MSAEARPLHLETVPYRTAGSVLQKERIFVIPPFVFGILVFTGTLIHFAVKAAWGITKGVLFVIGIPVLLFIAGLVILALLAAFLLPVLKGK